MAPKTTKRRSGGKGRSKAEQEDEDTVTRLSQGTRYCRFVFAAYFYDMIFNDPEVDRAALLKPPISIPGNVMSRTAERCAQEECRLLLSGYDWFNEKISEYESGTDLPPEPADTESYEVFCSRARFDQLGQESYLSELTQNYLSCFQLFIRRSWSPGQALHYVARNLGTLRSNQDHEDYMKGGGLLELRCVIEPNFEAKQLAPSYLIRLAAQMVLSVPLQQFIDTDGSKKGWFIRSRIGIMLRFYSEGMGAYLHPDDLQIVSRAVNFIKRSVTVHPITSIVQEAGGPEAALSVTTLQESYSGSARPPTSRRIVESRRRVHH